MQTQLPLSILATASGRRADAILRACVHCGFCNATCPTYLLTGDELDGPRGRIYLVKEMLEADAPSSVAREHLDRCLTCRACETTCPSGVAYGELAEIGRDFIEARDRRGMGDRLTRDALVRVVSSPERLAFFARLGRAFRWMLPEYLARAVPRIVARRPVAMKNHARRVVVLDGCAQRVTTPEVNAALARILDASDVKLVRVGDESCCGSLALHLGQAERARAAMRANVDALYAAAAGAEAIVSTASGCGVTVKEYGRLLADDPLYAERARWVAEHTCDASEYLDRIGAKLVAARPGNDRRVASAVHAATRPTRQRNRRGIIAASGLSVGAGCRRAPVLRLGGNLLGPPTCARRRPAAPQTHRADRSRAPT